MALRRLCQSLKTSPSLLKPASALVSQALRSIQRLTEADRYLFEIKTTHSISTQPRRVAARRNWLLAIAFYCVSPGLERAIDEKRIQTIRSRETKGPPPLQTAAEKFRTNAVRGLERLKEAGRRDYSPSTI